LISPIYHGGRLTGFVANFVHVNDIGAMSPGGFSPDARDNYQEGFQSRGLKIVERGKVRKDVVNTFLNMVRNPGMTALDLKSQLAANHVAKERMSRLYEDYGVETVEAVADALIAQSEQLMRQRLRELPDGQWQTRQYYDLPGVEPVRVHLTAIKEGDTLTYDFTGTDPEAPVGINCCYWATWGAMFAPIFPLIAWDIVWNEGVARPVRLIAAEGTCVNCIRPAPLSLATVANVQVVNNLSSVIIGKMFGASEKYKHRAMAVWRGSHAGMQVYGRKDGEPFVAYTTDSFAGAGGARAFADGVDHAGEVPNIVSRCSNVEQHELYVSLIYLYRHIVPDSGGAGKWRGGLSHELAFKPHETQECRGVTFAKAVRSPMAYGLFGGLPGSHVAYHLFRNAAAKELPHDFSSTEREGTSREDQEWGDFAIGNNDVMFLRQIGSGGYGDPLERDPNLVLQDVLGGSVSREAAEQVYGVLTDLERARVDESGTAALRARLRSERLGGRAPTRTRADVPGTGKRLCEYLQVNGDQVQCTYCGDHLAAASQQWKDVVPMRKLPTSAAGPYRSSGGEPYYLAQYYCPSCATVLDTDVLYGDDTPIYDTITAWPE
jgi:N-methylhydantoinase B